MKQFRLHKTVSMIFVMMLIMQSILGGGFMTPQKCMQVAR